MRPQALTSLLVVLSSCYLKTAKGMHAMAFDTAFDDSMEERRCYCDSCSSVFNDECDNCQATPGSVSSPARTLYGVGPHGHGQTCSSCVVSCLKDDLSVFDNNKHLRCRPSILEWKRRQLCLARQHKIPVLFKHVHKAGGTFFCNKVARPNVKCASNDNCLPGYNEELCSLRRFSLEEQGGLHKEYPELEFISMESSLPSRWMWGSYSWITMLRRPEDRTLSAFYWWLHELNDKEVLFQRVDGNLRKFDYCENYNASFPGPGTEMERWPTVKILQYWLSIYPDNQMVRTFCSDDAYAVPKGKLTEAHLNCAKRRLSYFGLVLIMERMEESMKVVDRYLGWDKLGFNISDSVASRSNFRSGSHGPTDTMDELQGSRHLAKTFEEMHELDRELYAFGEQIFDHALYSKH